MHEPESSEKHIMKKQNRVSRYDMRTSAKKTMNIEHTQKQRLPTNLNIEISSEWQEPKPQPGLQEGKGVVLVGLSGRGGGGGGGGSTHQQGRPCHTSHPCIPHSICGCHHPNTDPAPPHHCPPSHECCWGGDSSASGSDAEHHTSCGTAGTHTQMAWWGQALGILWVTKLGIWWGRR